MYRVRADRAGLRRMMPIALAVLAIGAAPAVAQHREVPPSREAAQYSFASIVKRTAPAVVNVYVRGKARTFVSPFADDPIFRRFFGDNLFGMPQERVQSSLGSGVIVSDDGVVVTNAHVIKVASATEISIVLADRREFNARVLLADDKTDIAVLRIEGGPGRSHVQGAGLVACARDLEEAQRRRQERPETCGEGRKGSASIPARRAPRRPTASGRRSAHLVAGVLTSHGRARR